MKTIKDNVESKYIINKSTFISILVKIKDINLVKEEIDKIKSKYKDATHYCYAYIIDEYKKSSDDGEPGGTAGVPIMDTLNKFELNYVLCVVVRYFGGIKLGAGGLVRAYRKSVLEALENALYKELINGYRVTLKTSYDKQKDLDYLLNDYYTKEYNENVTYVIECDEDTKNMLINKYQITKVEKIIIEKDIKKE